MTHSDDEVRRHLRLGEDSNWEFKEVGFAGNQPREPRRRTKSPLSLMRPEGCCSVASQRTAIS